MAKYTLGSGVVQFKGSRGGAVFQKSGKVFSIRKRSVPVAKKSAKQSIAKNKFSALANRWKALTVAQKNSFNNGAATYPRVDSLGNTYYQSGQNMQVGGNFQRLTAGRTITSVTSTKQAFVTISVDTFAARIVSQVMDIVIFPVSVASGYDIMVFTSGVVNIGTEPESLNYKQIGLFTQNQNTTLQNWFTRYVNVWGAITGANGKWFGVRLDLIQNNSGQVVQTLFGLGDITT